MGQSTATSSPSVATEAKAVWPEDTTQTGRTRRSRSAVFTVSKDSCSIASAGRVGFASELDASGQGAGKPMREGRRLPRCTR